MGVNDYAADSPSFLRAKTLRDVRELIADQIGHEVNQIKESDALDDDLGCDSLDKVEIIMRLEEAFDITIADEVADQVRTVGDVADKVATLLGRGPDPPCG